MQISRAVILDFDGIIVDSERGKFAWLKRVLGGMGYELHDEDFARMAGKKTAAFLRQHFGNQISDSEAQKIRRSWNKERIRNLGKYSKPIRGIIPFIKMLHEKGISVCLATGTDRTIARKTLRKLGIAHDFEAVITGKECARSKPDPRVCLLAVKALRVPKKDVLVIEDSAAGVLAAKRAGLRCAAITTTQSATQLKHADWVFESVRELRQKLFK
jgi:HAD superfamily hydrolase (TIGR01509 family)